MSSDRKGIFINGPPGSGKDTAAIHLVRSLGCRHDKFAAPLHDMVPAVFQLDRQDWLLMTADQRIKNSPQRSLNGMSPREAMIWLSEDVIKPQLGLAAFGQWALQRYQQAGHALTVYSDSGFGAEAGVLVEALGPENCLLLRLYRDGCTFKKDSRNYLGLIGVTAIEVRNDGTCEQFENSVGTIVRHWLSGRPHLPVGITAAA